VKKLILALTIICLLPGVALAKTFPPQTNIDLLKTWTVIFNKPIDESSVTKETVKMVSTDNQSMHCCNEVSGNILTIEPAWGYGCGKTYTLTIDGVTSGGQALNESSTLTFTTVAGTPPAAPVGLSWVFIGNDLHVWWDANEEADLKGYYVYRKYNSADGFSRITFNSGNQLLTKPSFTQYGLGYGQYVYMYIVAVDNEGCVSDSSDTMVAMGPVKNAYTEYIKELRATKIADPASGFVLSVGAKITNMIIETKIHKLGVESQATFIYMINKYNPPLASGQVYTTKGRKFNQICLDLLYGMISDDNAISQMQALHDS